MSTNQETPRLASAFMVVASLQFAVVGARFILPTTFGANGWLLAVVLLVVTAVLLGIATVLQRILMPDRRTVFSTGYFWAGLMVSLISSIVGHNPS